MFRVLVEFNGATVERVINNGFAESKEIIFNLHRPDFTSAKQVARQINRKFGPNVAKALDASSIKALLLLIQIKRLLMYLYLKIWI